MPKIIAIGGGEIGRPGFPVETTKIDKEIIKLSGKKNPKLLFIPTASSDSEGYVETVKKHFGKRLGCEIDVLYLIREKPVQAEIKKKIFGADIIYVGGGNTLKMMNAWRKTGVDKILKTALKKGIVLSGLSAGSICWFKYGNSDSRKFANKKTEFKLIKVGGLGFIDALNCPHYHTEKGRKKSLKEMMKKATSVAIALDNSAALEVVDEKFRIVAAKKEAKAYRVFWKKKKFFEEEIKATKRFKNLSEILKKY